MMELRPCTREHWEFVRQLRTDPRTKAGFVQQGEITPEQQTAYMERHWQEHWVAFLDGIPVGYVGSIDGDIRVCTHPDCQHLGIGRFMIEELMKRCPGSVARIKADNVASQCLFEACGFHPTFVVYER